MKALAVIPARFASTRFPGKPLALIGNKPMLQHVFERVSESSVFDKILIATDDERIFNATLAFGGDAVMTSEHHLTGTERCAEAAKLSGFSYDVVVNVQGDEPFISQEPLQQLLQLFNNKEVEIATLVQEIKDIQTLLNPNIVKIVLTTNAKALYFSRSPIPFYRNAEQKNWLQHQKYFKHIGLYAFKLKTLEEIVKLQPTPLEKSESLEQLRWLENGYSIFASETNYETIAVDTQEDLENAENFYSQLLKRAGEKP